MKAKVLQANDHFRINIKIPYAVLNIISSTRNFLVTVLVGEEKTRIELLTADLFMLSIKYVFLKFGK